MNISGVKILRDSGRVWLCMCVFTQKSCLLRWNKIKIWQLSLWLVFSFNSPVKYAGWLAGSSGHVIHSC